MLFNFEDRCDIVLLWKDLSIFENCRTFRKQQLVFGLAAVTLMMAGSLDLCFKHGGERSIVAPFTVEHLLTTSLANGEFLFSGLSSPQKVRPLYLAVSASEHFAGGITALSLHLWNITVKEKRIVGTIFIGSIVN